MTAGPEESSQSKHHRLSDNKNKDAEKHSTKSLIWSILAQFEQTGMNQKAVGTASRSDRKVARVASPKGPGAERAAVTRRQEELLTPTLWK
jgi:hypothetical protein